MVLDIEGMGSSEDPSDGVIAMSVNLKEKIGILFHPNHDIDEDTRDIIKSFSQIYYRYGENQPEWQGAFRNAVQWMCGLIAEGKWASVQKRFYRVDKE